MRNFLPDPVAPNLLARPIQAAHRAPSVGFMQPWRFLRVTDPALRQQIHQHVDAERLLTAKALGTREDEFMRLKVEGILACGELLVVGLIDQRGSYIFGRRTMPEMDLASASWAIQNFWLAARAEGIEWAGCPCLILNACASYAKCRKVGSLSPSCALIMSRNL